MVAGALVEVVRSRFLSMGRGDFVRKEAMR
jgi:hypothetical protein